MSKHLANCLVRIGGLILIVQALLAMGNGLFTVVQSHVSSRSVGMEFGDIAWFFFPTLVPFFGGFILLKTSGFFASLIVQEPPSKRANGGGI